MFKIDKGIPVPAYSTRPRLYPWDRLEPGDSFFVPGKTTTQLNGARQHQQRKSGRRYTIRAMDGGVRIWRIE